MKRGRAARLALAWLALCGTMPLASARNLIVFVADGLRPGSINAADAPTLTALREQGVRFVNSHSLFPTFTTPNASAIATGHYLGDTGDFSNDLYVGHRLFDAHEFGRSVGGPVGFIENDAILSDLDDHFEGNYLGANSLLASARAAGLGTAAIGKLGPAAIQDISQLAPRAGQFTVPATIVIDDATGASTAPLAPGVPLADEVVAALDAAGLPRVTPTRDQSAGDAQHPGTQVPNSTQQNYFIHATTQAVLPLLQRRGRPFVLVFWSRDPDGSQHNQGDSLNALSPGINGPTSRAGVHDADDDLRQLLDYLRADPQLQADTDVFVTSDHGFATISRAVLDAQGARSQAASAQAHYADTPAGSLPSGFLAIDLAQALRRPLYDADTLIDTDGQTAYQRIEPPDAKGFAHHPVIGDGLIGGTGIAERNDAQLIVTAGGGSDLLYLPHGDRAQVRGLLEILAKFDYVDGLFVDDRYGAMPGALPLSSIGLVGAARLPRPAIVVSFKTFLLGGPAGGLDPQALPDGAALLQAIQIADTTLQQGQGMHGSFGRDNTFNTMLAIGPDFRAGYVDSLPASNADIAPTLLKLLGLPMQGGGTLTGRVLEEALRADAGSAPSAQHCVRRSSVDVSGQQTELYFQRYAGRLYFDQARRVSARNGVRAGEQCTTDRSQR